MTAILFLFWLFGVAIGALFTRLYLADRWIEGYRAAIRDDAQNGKLSRQWQEKTLSQK